ncbi:exported hypothetical protein [Candidatus Terasakiella magnetica]|uniref:Lipoprotein n=1 Tax=Candidatus Terasakiella magnetica TaxID=1867952 RepID=A0A1C3RF80_9PROT|nr:hypothetical protein [Candidatus Terasakiella magnetica]SCA55940.1 exported hypothetical protein [Candidatus Terasakiella magnetica]
MARKLMMISVLTLMLTGCLTNKERYYSYHQDEFDGSVTVVDEEKEELNIAGFLVTVGATAALVLAAMADTPLK